MYDFTARARGVPAARREQQLVFEAIARRQASADRFLGVMTGSVPIDEFFKRTQHVAACWGSAGWPG